MKTEYEWKELVRLKYADIALQVKETNVSSCCGTGGCSTEVYNFMNDDYSGLKGYDEDADLGLGCGLPTAFANIRKGDTVIDLGSRAGNDAFVAREECGPEGKVIGVDFTEAMISKARTNAKKLGLNNVEFRSGDMENLPVNDGVADVIVSNWVLNLVPNKASVFAEVYRVLKPGGHFCISDVVLVGDLPAAIQSDAEMYAGCVSGAIQKNQYLGFIFNAGFQNVSIQKQKPISIPRDILSKYLSSAEIDAFISGETGIYSITVYAEKPKAKLKMSLKELSVSGNAFESAGGCC